jgi:hypothetical protein
MGTISWRRVILRFASDPARRSSWHVTERRAVEQVRDLARSSIEVTAEHMRALAQLFEEDACANWYAMEADGGRERLKRDQFDWTDFELERAKVLFRPGAVVLWTSANGDIEAIVDGPPLAVAGKSEWPDAMRACGSGVRIPIRTAEGPQKAWAHELVPL